MATEAATVEVLTAEVRTLMVGSRQVTQSVFNQLDEVEFADMIPFGRVRSRSGNSWSIEVVGATKEDRALCRANVPHVESPIPGSLAAMWWRREADKVTADELVANYEAASALPLIVLAGLR